MLGYFQYSKVPKDLPDNAVSLQTAVKCPKYY